MDFITYIFRHKNEHIAFLLKSVSLIAGQRAKELQTPTRLTRNNGEAAGVTNKTDAIKLSC